MNQSSAPSSPPAASCHTDRLVGVLLGTALGDALGLPAEGMNAKQIARRWGRQDRFRLLGQTGFVSDDTEQAALLSECLIRSHEDPTDCARYFRRALLGWVARLPFGVGLATLRAGGRIALGRNPSGVMSAGNGAAMRAAVVGVFFHDEPEQRLSFGTALAETTHLDWRAVEGALLVAELAALCARAQPAEDRRALALTAIRSFPDEPLREASEQALSLADAGTPSTKRRGV